MWDGAWRALPSAYRSFSHIITRRNSISSSPTSAIRTRGSYRHFLSAAEFNARYAPTEAQERTVVTELQHAGFTITQRFPNRTIVDATAPSSTVERFFATEMHTVQQGKVRRALRESPAATVPASIASLVHSASLSNLVVVRTVADQSGGPIKSLSPKAKVVTHTPGSRQGPLASDA